MKRFLPATLVVLFAVWLIASLKPQPESGFAASDFGTLPILANGRIQPLDSMARNSLLQVRARQTVPVEGQHPMTASQWLLELTMRPEAADGRKVFRIDNLEVLALMQLPQHEKYYSFSQLRPGYEEIGRQASRVLQREKEKLSAPENRTVFEKQLMKLYSAVMLYQQLQISLRPPGSGDFPEEIADFQATIAPGVAAVRAREAGSKYDEAAYEKIIVYLSQFQNASRFAAFLAVPPVLGQPRDAWQSVGSNLMELVHGASLSPAVTAYALMSKAYRNNNDAEFEKARAEYHRWLLANRATEVAKARHEAFFSHFQFFYKAMVIYVTAFLLASFSLLTFGTVSAWSESFRRSAFWLIAFAGIIHTCGLIFRMVLEGRPPVTNLYSSAIFIGWGALVLGLILEWIYKVGIGSIVASLAGFVTLVIAHNLALGGDTMEMLRAVLDTNFWLATHVVVVTLGYASTFFAGLLAILYIVLGVFTPRLTQRLQSGEGTKRGVGLELGKALSKMVYGIICFATLFSFTGTVLGGIWADQSWGRFWGWDPKENGALLIVIWNALILHARWGGLVRERGLMALAVFGNIVTSFSWFGVNMLGIGLHSYGFMDAAFRWLMLFDATQAIVIGLGLLPLAYWRSFREALAKPAATAARA